MKRRLLTILCLLYVVLVLYGSMMPFDLANDAQTAADNRHDFWRYWPVSNDLPVSKSDMIANFILYLPLGAMIVTACIVRRGRSRVGSLVLAWAIGTAVSFTVEMVQAYEPSRTSSVNDAFTNSIGTLAGGILALMIGRTVWIAWRRRIQKVASARPIVMAAAVVILLWAVDAFYPFLPTLDVGQIKHSIKLCLQHRGAAGLAVHVWHHWLVERVAMGAVLSILLASSLRLHGRPRWMLGAITAVFFTTGVEIGKTFITSRFCNPANIMMSACGAAAGMIVGWALAGLSGRSKLWLAILGTLCYVVYLEWAPFDWVWNAAAMAAKMPSGAEWLPLYSYAMHGRGEQVGLLIRSLLILGTLAYLMQMARPLPRAAQGESLRGDPWPRALRAAVFAGLLGVVLELGQFLLPDRIPSVTDVFCFAVGGAMGSLLASAHQAKKTAAWRDHPQSPIRQFAR